MGASTVKNIVVRRSAVVELKRHCGNVHEQREAESTVKNKKLSYRGTVRNVKGLGAKNDTANNNKQKMY
jgi:hypothetical protein